MTAPAVPKSFLWKRLQSLAGFGLVLYLMQHLFVNSQAALFFGEDGIGFIRAVNAIQELPYLLVIEIAVLGIPFVIHGWWGLKYLQTSKANSIVNDGKNPYLGYGRNHAYTWQRITSWILLVGIIAHVVHMRILEYPVKAREGIDRFYMVRVDADSGLYTVSERLGVKLFSPADIEKAKSNLPKTLDRPENPSPEWLVKEQNIRQQQDFVKGLAARPLKEGQYIAVAKNFGTAELLMLRETFKIPVMMALYTLFVLAASFHAFNGLWTFMITWGVTLTQRSQHLMLKFSKFLMIVVGFLGLITIFGTYWINLRH